MEIKHKGETAKPQVEYKGMSLRHERVANESMPRINIFFSPGNEERAHQISYGIEEEGLPRCGFESNEPFAEALEDTIKKGLGVAIGVDEKTAQIFCRQFKKNESFMRYHIGRKDITAANEKLRIVGKNASRILKHKPFIFDES